MGGFLLAVMSPYIETLRNTNANDVVKHLLQKYAEYHAEYYAEHAESPPSECVIGMVVSGRGIKVTKMDLKTKVIVRLMLPPSVYPQPRRKKIVNRRGVVQREMKVRKRPAANKPVISKVIGWIDQEFGLKTPLIASGGKCFNRGVSTRSDDRVLSHMVITPTKGTNVCDVHQTIMRCGGYTVDVREKNGFGYEVKTLMQESDYNIITNLFRLTIQWLDSMSKSAPGEQQQEWLKNPTNNKKLMEMIARRPLAARGAGKQLEHNITRHSRGAHQARRGFVEGETYAQRLAREKAANLARQLKLGERIDQEAEDRAAYERDKDKDLSPIEPPGKPMSLPMAVRHTDWFKNLGHEQAPGVNMIDVSKVGGFSPMLSNISLPLPLPLPPV